MTARLPARSPVVPMARRPDVRVQASAPPPAPSSSQLLIEGGTDALLIEGGTDALLLQA